MLMMTHFLRRMFDIVSVPDISTIRVILHASIGHCLPVYERIGIGKIHRDAFDGAERKILALA